MGLPAAGLPTAVLKPAELGAIVGLEVEIGLAVVYVSVQGQFVIVSVVGYVRLALISIRIIGYKKNLRKSQYR